MGNKKYVVGVRPYDQLGENELAFNRSDGRRYLLCLGPMGSGVATREVIDATKTLVDKLMEFEFVNKSEPFTISVNAGDFSTSTLFEE